MAADTPSLLILFEQLGLAALLGFMVGLEREMAGAPNPHGGLRDFVMFALLGAASALAAILYDNSWLILIGFLGVMSLVLSGYWITVLRNRDEDTGITTEIAAVLTFFMGVLVMKGVLVLAIALGIVVLAVLSQKVAIKGFSSGVKRFELEAALQFLIITFIVLPVLPNQSLDAYFTLPAGHVQQVDPDGSISLAPAAGRVYATGESMEIYTEAEGRVGHITIDAVGDEYVHARYEGKLLRVIDAGEELRVPVGIDWISTLLSALNPYQIWLIVVLVSLVSFVGYVLIKVVGSSSGIGLTGLIGGLASSTVTTLAFAKRSLEMPQWNRNFAAAVVLASSVMFPRLLLQIGIVNQGLMKNMAPPILVMGATGLVMAAFFFLRARGEATQSTTEMGFTNPFSLKSAITFGAVFATILMVTRLAISYLGEAWLPLIAVVSGLTDADAIAFSLSAAQQAGVISLDWASFNLVLGALSNTFMKLFLVFSLGHRGLFKKLLAAFLIIGAAGIGTMFLYYDF